MIERMCDIRVGYRDTDQMGVVHHAVYLEYFEQGRTELLRQIGMAYSTLEHSGVALPVLEYSARMIRPAKYDDILSIRSQLIIPTGPRVRIEYQITRGGEVLVDGHTVHAFTRTTTLRPIRPPEEFLKIVHRLDVVDTTLP